MVATESSESQAPTTSPPKRRFRTKFLSILLFGILLGCGVHLAAKRLHDKSRAAGFVEGLMHGALMPIAMPNLLVGNDVTIYAANNTGRTYKLGYTVGVNGCGALFFGVFYWRVNRWRRKRMSTMTKIQ